MALNVTRRAVMLMVGANVASSAAGAISISKEPAPLDNPPQASVRRAVPASHFLMSLGICIHHAQKVPLGTYIQPLRYLGLRNIRDDYGPPSSYVTLFKALGVRSVLIAQGKPLDEAISGYRKLAQEGALLAVEGPNEPNNFPINYDGQKGGGFSRIPGRADWTAVARYQRDLYERVKADDLLKDIPVFNVSETGAQSPNTGLQYLEIPSGADTVMSGGTRYADYLNVHNYVSSSKPRYVDNQAWQAADPLLNSVWDGLWGNHGVTWGHNYRGYDSHTLPHIPRVTTETGWDSKGIGGERTQGIMLLNTFLAQYKRGWSHTFIYMIRDGEGGGGNQGVFNKDSSPKIAATYIHNFTTILQDTGVYAQETNISYSIKNAPDYVHDLLLQKSNGDLYLIVWAEKVSGNTTIEISTDLNGYIGEIFDPTLSSAMIEKIEDISSFIVQLSDHCVLIKLSR